MHNIEIEELEDKTLSAVARYINAKNKANKVDFPIISADDIQEPKVRDGNIVCLANGEIKGLAKYTIPYSDLDLRKTRKTGRPKKDEEAEKVEA